MTVDGAAISFTVWPGASDEPGVVFVHGGSASAEWWHPLIARADLDATVVAIDLSGHGLSEWREAYTFDGWVREVLAVARAVSPQGFVLVGHSLGAAVSCAAALSADEVRRVVCLDAAGGPPRSVSPRSAAGAPRLFADADAARRAFVARKATWPAWIASRIAATSVVLAEDGWSMRRDPRVRSEAVPPLGLEDLSPTPVDVIAAVRSPFFADMLRVLVCAGSGKLSHVSARTLAGVGHDLLMEDPDAVASLLREILEFRGVEGEEHREPGRLATLKSSSPRRRARCAGETGPDSMRRST